MSKCWFAHIVKFEAHKIKYIGQMINLFKVF